MSRMMDTYYVVMGHDKPIAVDTNQQEALRKAELWVHTVFNADEVFQQSPGFWFRTDRPPGTRYVCAVMTITPEVFEKEIDGWKSYRKWEKESQEADHE